MIHPFLESKFLKPCMGGIVIVSDEGGTVVGDVENLKISTFWTFEFFECFLWVEPFGHLGSDLK